MYIPKSNLEIDIAVLYAFMREHNFATLVTQHEGRLDATHLPVMIDSERGVIKAHLARANDQWKVFDGGEALIIFQGPHAYVSPTWYETHPSVPTWNYATVHVYGVPRLIDDDATVRAMLRELVANHEHGRDPEWMMNLPEDYLHKMMAAIVAFELPIERIEGKYKLSQNRSEVDQDSVIEHLLGSPYPVEVETAELMASRRPQEQITT
ncbi:MAG TPA: FMN-binding negative transcriptional regulator [Phototrophicaceae bacterium]|nr:FMN-binding negative transcriptional regulator [Phototrophicaceae bacterium]